MPILIRFPRLVALAGWALVASAPSALCAGPSAELKGYPKEIGEIRIERKGETGQQPALFYHSGNPQARPLLVALHSWSGDYLQSSQGPYADWCVANDWVFIHPNFRGPNRTPEACGSELVVQDILSAVAYARRRATVDPNRIYLVGGSGGGHASLLMAGRAPEVWAGVSAWVPIVDVQAWHAESEARKSKYARDIEKACGGPPRAGTEAAKQAALRSPLTYLKAALGVNLDINAGIHDGHTGSVPVSHSLRAFNAVAEAGDRLTPEEIEYCVLQEKPAPSMGPTPSPDPLYGTKTVLFRRSSGRARVTLFEGGHESVPQAALEWLKRQRRNAP